MTEQKHTLDVRSLSIGNYLQRNGVVVRIDGRSIFDIWDNDGGRKLGYEPIPITMGWIQRFGFVFEELGNEPTIEEQSYRRAIRGYGSRSFEIEFNRNWNTFNLCFIDGEIIEYRYVHELQNLYYLFMGVELPFDFRIGANK